MAEPEVGSDRLTRMRRARGVWAVLAVGALLVGCSGQDDDDTAATMAFSAAEGDADDGAGAVSTGAAEGEEATAARDEAGGVSGGGGGGTVAPPGSDARVVRSAHLSIDVADGGFREAFAEASRVATALGGFVEASTTSSYDEGRASGEVTIRVPVDRFDDALERLGELGEVVSTDVQGEDVSAQLVDLAARLRSLRAEEDALNTLMAEAADVGEVLSVRDTLSGVRTQIEQLAAQEAALEDRAAFSTITASLAEDTEVAIASSADDDLSLGDAVGTAVDVAEAVVAAAIVAVGLAVPLAPLALAGWWYVRRRRRIVAAA